MFAKLCFYSEKNQKFLKYLNWNIQLGTLFSAKASCKNLALVDWKWTANTQTSNKFIVRLQIYKFSTNTTKCRLSECHREKCIFHSTKLLDFPITHKMCLAPPKENFTCLSNYPKNKIQSVCCLRLNLLPQTWHKYERFECVWKIVGWIRTYTFLILNLWVKEQKAPRHYFYRQCNRVVLRVEII